MDIDDTDRKIVNALLGNGRASAREIADETDLAATTVQRRLDALEADGVIETYAATVDYEALGYDVTVVLHLGVTGDGVPELVDRLCAHDRMVSVYEVTGSHDVVAVAKFEDTDAMDAQIKALLTDPDVESVTTSIVLDTVRENEQFAVDLTES